MALVGQLGCDAAGLISSSLWVRAILSPKNSFKAIYMPDWDLVTSFAGMGERDGDSTNGSAGPEM